MHANQSTAGVSLADLFDERTFAFTDDIVAHACCHDYRQCRSGDLFVAISEGEDDGHFHVDEAIQRGAKAILAERPLPVQVPQCIVPNAKMALAQLCQRLVGNPGSHIPIVGCLGSGSRLVAEQLTHVFDRTGQSPARFGPSGYSDGIEHFHVATAPTANRYACWLSSVATNGCTQAVVEMPQAGLANSIYSGAPTESLLLTGFDTLSGHLHSSRVIQTQLDRAYATLKPSGTISANVDCPFVKKFVEGLDHPVLRVSLDPITDADIKADVIERTPSEQTALLSVGSDSAVLRTRIIGDHYLRCCLVSLAAGLQQGLRLEEMLAGIEAVQSIPGYLERVECGQPFSVFADAALTPADFRRALRTARSTTSGRLICVFGEGQLPQPWDDNASVRARRGTIAEKNADYCVITCDEAGQRSPLQGIHDILDGFRDAARPQLIPNRLRAIHWALSQAKPGDAVLLAGPHNAFGTTEEPHKEATRHCSDALSAKYWLYGLDEHATQQSRQEV